MKSFSKTWSDDQFIKAVASSNCIAEVQRKLGLSTLGGNFYTVKKYIKLLNLNTDHFLSRWDLASKARKSRSAYTVEELFSINNIDRQHIKRYIIANKILAYECSKCELSSWMNESISLELDHINGINNDNRLENLRFLCPNCHSQTSTYCGRKLKKEKRITTCLDCGTLINWRSKRCKTCSSSNKKQNYKNINWPPYDQLLSRISQIGRKAVAEELGANYYSLLTHCKKLEEQSRVEHEPLESESAMGCRTVP